MVKAHRIKNIMKKSKSLGSAPLLPNKLAPGRKVWSPDDSSHIARQTPLDTKRKELAEVRSEEAPADRKRSQETKQIRQARKN